MTSENPPMVEHPDLAEFKQAHDLLLRRRYEAAAESPSGRLIDGLVMLAGFISRCRRGLSASPGRYR
jgi:hypothetical protein